MRLMSKKRTRKQKKLSQSKIKQLSKDREPIQKKQTVFEYPFFRQDLTKVSLVSMLAIGIELTIWKLFFK